MALIYDLEPEDGQEVVDIIQGRLMPAAASLLGRWLRVRRPSGLLDFGETFRDSSGQRIPPGPDGNGAYDADVVVKVTSQPGRDMAPCDLGIPTTAEATLFEPATSRPVFGEILVCEASAFIPFTSLLQFVMAELMRVMGFQEDLFEAWIGAEGIGDVIRVVTPAQARRPDIVGPVGIGQYGLLITRNALREARLHFGCPEMTGLLMSNKVGAPTFVADLLSMRHYNGELMRAGFSVREIHYGRVAMTDIMMGAMQDTGWYDVKYGSGGFNSYGYKAGCPFVNGTIADTRDDPVAGQFLCSASDVGRAACFHDFSGQGVCNPLRMFGDTEYDDFYSVDLGYEGRTLSCQITPTARCINEVADNDEDREVICATDFSCSASGQVLVEGVPCSDFVDGCPPDELMCGDPGLLTCAGPELNDCHGQGDCRQGRCFCHMGFGGDDCAIEVCTSGCPGGRQCPPSGFCGVPECGEWSVGDTGKGTPCTSA